MSNEELEKFNSSLQVFTKHYNGAILNEEELNTILSTSQENIETINELIRQEQLRKKQDGSLEIYIANKISVDGIKIKSKTDFDDLKNKKYLKNDLNFSALLLIFNKYYNGKILTVEELEIIANTSTDKKEKIEEIIRQENLSLKEDGRYLRYIRNCACLVGKKISFDNFPVKNTVYTAK